MTAIDRGIRGRSPLSMKEHSILSVLAAIPAEHRPEQWKLVEANLSPGSFADEVGHALMWKINRTEPTGDAYDLAIQFLREFGSSAEADDLQRAAAATTSTGRGA